MTRKLETLDLAALAHVTGGAGDLAAIAKIDMGPPKYSAKWWEFVNNRTRP
jgi:hypothetical protein